VADDGRILSFQEKGLSAAARLVSAGAYAFEPALLDWIVAGEPASLEEDVFPVLVTQGALSAFCVSDRFLDMGTPEGLVELECWLVQHTAAPLRRQR
jgi:NDP-sugar pyrophosphorylase family protein